VEGLLLPSQMAQQRQRNDPPREGVSHAWSSISNFDTSITDGKTYDEMVRQFETSTTTEGQPLNEKTGAQHHDSLARPLEAERDSCSSGIGSGRQPHMNLYRDFNMS